MLLNAVGLWIFFAGWMYLQKSGVEKNEAIASFFEVQSFPKENYEQKRFPFPLWGSICKEHYVMNWKLSYNVFVCRKETLIYKEEEGEKRERSEYIEKLKALWIERKHPFSLLPFLYYCMSTTTYHHCYYPFCYWLLVMGRTMFDARCLFVQSQK